MKKLQLLLLVLVLVAVASCKKESVNQTSAPKYVKAIAGTFIAKEGDMTLQSAPDSPTGTERQFMVYRHKLTGSDWEFVDGTEFITGSAAYNDWQQGLKKTPQFVYTFGMGETIYNTFCPVEPLRFVVKTMKGTTPAYLGI